MFRAYQISTADKPTEEELAALRNALPMVLENDRWHRCLSEGPEYVMDAGGNDDVAFAASLFYIDEGKVAIRVWLMKWVLRPSDFHGRIEVEPFTNEEEEDKAWQKYRHNLKLGVSSLGKKLYKAAPLDIGNSVYLLETIDVKYQSFQIPEFDVGSLKLGIVWVHDYSGNSLPARTKILSAIKNAAAEHIELIELDRDHLNIEWFMRVFGVRWPPQGRGDVLWIRNGQILHTDCDCNGQPLSFYVDRLMELI
jgi:hypothetical protein